jgi:ubiquitin C-terminal hydrolase
MCAWREVRARVGCRGDRYGAAMDLRPDFDTWQAILLSSLTAGDEFIDLLPDFNRFVDQILANGVLDPPLTDQTEQFLTVVVKTTVASIMNMGNLCSDEERPVADFLISTSRLAAWAASADRFPLVSDVIGIFDPMRPLYVENCAYGSESPLLRSVQSAFVNAHGASLLIARVVQTDPPPVLHHFDLLFTLISRIYQGDQLPIDDFLTIMRPFQTALEEAKDVDSSKLASTIQDVVRMSVLYPGHSFEPFFSFLFQFADGLLVSNNLQKQLLGGQILSSVHAFAPWGPILEPFRAWKETTKLETMLMERDLHPQLLEVLARLVDELLTVDRLWSFLEKTEKAHSSQRGPMLAIVGARLRNLPTTDARDFLLRLLRRPELSPELLDFVANSACSFGSTSPELVIEIVNLMLADCRRPGALGALCQFAQHKARAAIRKHLLSQAILLLRDFANQEFACDLLMKILNESRDVDKYLPADFTSEIAAALSIDGCKRTKIFDLLKVAFPKANDCLAPSFLKQIFQAGVDEDVWEFLQTAISEFETELFEEGAIELIVDEIRKYPFEDVTLKFSLFLFYFIYFVNSKAKAIRRDQSRGVRTKDWYVCKWPLVHLDFLINVFATCKSDLVMKHSENYCLSFLIKAREVVCRDVVAYLIQIFEETRNRTRILHLICVYIGYIEDRIDLLDFGIKRHRAKESDPPGGWITVTVSYGSWWSFPFRIGALARTDELKERVARKVGWALSSFSLRFRTEYLRPGFSLRSYGIRNGSTLSVYAPQFQTVVANRDTPTLAFADMNFAAKLLVELERSTDAAYLKICRRLLNLLPSDENMVQSLNDMQKYVDSLRNCTNESIFGYKLQILVCFIHQRQIAELFQGASGCAFLVDVLVSKNCVFKGLTQILIILALLQDSAIHRRADEVIPCLFRLFGIVRNDRLFIAQLLEGFSRKYREETTKIVYQHSKLLEKAIERIDHLSFAPFVAFLLNLNDVTAVAEFCLKRLATNEISFLKILREMITQIPDLQLLRRALTATRELLDTSKGSILAVLCQIAHHILFGHPSLQREFASITKQLLPIAFSTDNDDVRQATLNLCAEMLAGNVDAEAFTTLSNLVDIDIDRWNYMPSANSQSVPGRLGLRNLGSTCYINSIFQQLFWTFPFRYLILTSQLTEESHLQLKRIFTELLISKRRFSDTQAFCDCWKGWGKRRINPKEQQDAFEFLQLVLDQLPPELNSMFKGTIKHTIEGTSEKFENHSEEFFYTIALDIKNLKDVYESFQSFLQSESFIGDNQYSIGDRKIDARKYARIEIAPKVLVLQLKRFDYNLRTWARIKVNDHYEFPTTLDIRECMVDQDEAQLYQLQGVVLHSGTAQGGHYTSVIKVDDQWILFNDVEVTELTEEQFEGLTVGDNDPTDEYDTNVSAYLLFYVKINTTVAIGKEVLRFDAPPNVDSFLDKRLVAQIEQANQEHFKIQSLFSPFSANFFLNLNDHRTLIPYYFNVFCHSSLVPFIARMNQKLDELVPNSVLDYCLSNFPKISTIFINCSSTDFMNSIIRLMINTFRLVDPNTAFPLAQQIFDLLQTALGMSWKQISPISKCLAVSFRQNPEYVDAALSNGWVKRTIEFVGVVYEQQRSVVVIQNLDLSDVFRLMMLLFNKSKDPSFREIVKFSSSIFQSPLHSQTFVNLLTRLYSGKMVDLASFIGALSVGKMDADFSCSAVVNSLKDVKDADEIDEVMSMMCQRRHLGFVRKFCDEVINRSDVAIKLLLDFPRQTLFRFLLDETANDRTSASYMIGCIFPTACRRLTQVPDDCVPDGVERVNEAINKFIMEMRADEDYFEPRPESIGSEKSRYRMTKFLHFLAWQYLALHKLNEGTFQIVYSLFTKLVNARKEPRDYNIFSCLRLISFFPVELWRPRFSVIYEAVMASFIPKNSDPLIAFSKFKRFIPHLRLEDLKVVVGHQSFRNLASDVANDRANSYFDVINSLVDKVIQNHDDADIRNGIFCLLTGFDYFSGTSRPDIYGRLLEVVVDEMPPRLVERVKVIATQITRESEVFLGCTLGTILFKHGLLDLDVSDFHPLFGILARALPRGQQPLAIVKPISDYISMVCKARGVESCDEFLAATYAILKKPVMAMGRQNIISVVVEFIFASYETPSEISARLLEIITSVEVVAASDLYGRLTRHIRPGGEWAKLYVGAFVKSQIRDYGGWNKGQGFFSSVLKLMSLEEAVGLLRRICGDGPPRDHYEWRMCSTVFQAFPDDRAALIDVFPIKERPPQTMSTYTDAAVDVIFGAQQVEQSPDDYPPGFGGEPRAGGQQAIAQSD